MTVCVLFWLAGLASLLCAAIMAGGYLTFGGASQGLILNSYATTDPLALLARLGICASIIFSYPLNFVGLREGVLNLFKLDGTKAPVHIITTIVLLCLMNGVALVLKNLGLVVAVGGAALGTSLVYTFPALMFIQATRLKKKELEAKGQKLDAGREMEMKANVGCARAMPCRAVPGVSCRAAPACLPMLPAVPFGSLSPFRALRHIVPPLPCDLHLHLHLHLP